MRPSGITDGIAEGCGHRATWIEGRSRFNEAVGYYRRNLGQTGGGATFSDCFNEAVGYYRRNPESRLSLGRRQDASMRPSGITDGIYIVD